VGLRPVLDGEMKKVLFPPVHSLFVFIVEFLPGAFRKVLPELFKIL
jgi:hypothetical protein